MPSFLYQVLGTAIQLEVFETRRGVVEVCGNAECSLCYFDGLVVAQNNDGAGIGLSRAAHESVCQRERCAEVDDASAAGVHGSILVADCHSVDCSCEGEVCDVKRVRVCSVQDEIEI